MEFTSGWSFIQGNKTRLWTVCAARARAMRRLLTPAARSQPSAVAYDGPYLNMNGFQLQAAQAINEGDPVVLGPQTKVSGMDKGWYTMRMERGQPEDFAILHKKTDQLYTDTFMTQQPQGRRLLVTKQEIVEYDIASDVILLPNGMLLLDPDHEIAPPLAWRVPNSNVKPPPEMPLWYFLDHSNTPNLRISKDLYKIARADGSPGYSHKAIVFEADRDIQAGEWLSFAYEQPNPDWA